MDIPALLAADGRMEDTTCSGFTADGGDNGAPTALVNNVDFDNVFVSQMERTLQN